MSNGEQLLDMPYASKVSPFCMTRSLNGGAMPTSLEKKQGYRLATASKLALFSNEQAGRKSLHVHNKDSSVQARRPQPSPLPQKPSVRKAAKRIMRIRFRPKRIRSMRKSAPAALDRGRRMPGTPSQPAAFFKGPRPRGKTNGAWLEGVYTSAGAQLLFGTKRALARTRALRQQQ